MATRHSADEADIRQRINQLTEAIRAIDLERVMSFYAPDIVSFDIVPPLQHLGAGKTEELGKRVRDLPASARLRDSRSHDHGGR